MHGTPFAYKTLTTTGAFITMRVRTLIATLATLVALPASAYTIDGVVTVRVGDVVGETNVPVELKPIVNNGAAEVRLS